MYHAKINVKRKSKNPRIVRELNVIIFRPFNALTSVLYTKTRTSETNRLQHRLHDQWVWYYISK